MDDCPECFATPGGGSGCGGCEFAESCRYCAATGRSVNSRLGHVSYDRYEYSREANGANEANPPPDPASEVRIDYVRMVMNFLMSCDRYTLKLLQACLEEDVSTLADLGRQVGVSRQAVHRKLVDSCTEHPELREFFIAKLPRCSRLLRDSARIGNRGAGGADGKK